MLCACMHVMRSGSKKCTLREDGADTLNASTHLGRRQHMHMHFAVDCLVKCNQVHFLFPQLTRARERIYLHVSFFSLSTTPLTPKIRHTGTRILHSLLRGG